MNNLSDFTQGDSKTYKVAFTNDSGNPIDISNWTVWMTFKRNIRDNDDFAALQKKITDHTDPDADPVNGITVINLTPEDTNSLEGKYFYDLQVKRPGGIIKTVSRGFVIVTLDTTEDAA